MRNGGGSGAGGGGAAAAPPAANAALNANAPAPFLSKTYDLVDDPATDAIVSWGTEGDSFVVWNHSEFARDLLPKHFKHNNFCSFVRQLNTYGFRKANNDRWEFANEQFKRGQKHLLNNIKRRKPPRGDSQAQTAAGKACVEVGKFGMEEEIERLKRDKNVLMQELVRLRQQQQAADHQLQVLGERFQGMERRQQLMMSFLAKAIQSPGLVAQLVQQNENKRHVAGVNKKRRLQRQGNNLEDNNPSLDRQIIQYKPPMTDSAAAMIAEMLQFDSSSRLEPEGNPNAFMVDGFSSPVEALGTACCLERNSGHTLAEVPQKPDVPPFMPVSSGFSTAPSSSTATQEQCELGMAEIHVPDVFEDISMMPEAEMGNIPVENFIMPEDESVYLDEISAEMDGATLAEEVEDDQMFSDIMSFLLASPSPGEKGEAASSVQGAEEKQQEALASGGVWDARKMESLTAQMEVLASEF